MFTPADTGFLTNSRWKTILSLRIYLFVLQLQNTLPTGGIAMRNVRCIKSVLLLIIVLALGCAVESAHADITIPSGVTSIEDEAFYGDTAVTGVILPDTGKPSGIWRLPTAGFKRSPCLRR